MNRDARSACASIHVTMWILALILFFNTGCSTASPKATTVAPTHSATAAPTLTQASATIIPAATLPPVDTATPEPPASAAESISQFQTYDDFSGPFDENRWFIHQPEGGSPFSFEAQDGILTIHQDDEMFGYNTLSLDVLPQALTQDVNGVSVLLPPGEQLDETTDYGLHVTLTDQKTHWSYRCYNQVQASRLFCDLEDAVSGAVLYNMDAIPMSRAQAHLIQAEWIPQSGLLLTFLDGQLLDFQTLTDAASLSVENAGLFGVRNDGYAGGDLLFSDFRLGAYRESGLTLPDDLLPHWEKQYRFSAYGIDYYTYDDFDSPLFHGSIDLNRWIVNYEDEQRTSDASYFFGQENGQMLARGRMVNQTVIAPQEGIVRGFQVDIIPQNVQHQDGQLTFELSVRNAIKRDSIGRQEFEFACMVEFNAQDDEHLWCGYYRQESDQMINTTPLSPIFDGMVNTLRMEYDDSLGSFLTYVNGNLINRMPVEEAHQQLIRNSNLTAGIFYIQNANGSMAIDNVLLGVQGEPDSSSRFEAPGNVMGVLPHSDLYLYDDFDESQFDNCWNTARWDEDRIKSPAGFYQRDGHLILSYLPETVNGTFKLTSKYLYNEAEKNRNAAQITISPNPQTDNRDIGLIFSMDQMSVGSFSNDFVSYSNTLSYQGNLSCIVQYMGDGAYLECGVCLTSEGCGSSEENRTIILEKSAIDPYTQHVLALEFDEKTSTYFVYLEGELLAQHQTINTAIYTHVFGFRASGGNQPGPELMIDHVMLGTPAEHLEVLKYPDKPLPLFVENAYTMPEPEKEEGPSLQDRMNEIVETSAFTRFFTPIDIHSGIVWHDSGWNIGGKYEQRADNSIILPPESMGEYSLELQSLKGYPLSEINAVSYTLSPIDTPPYGWNTGIVLRRSETFHFNCYVHYEMDNTYFACQGYDEERPEQAYASPQVAVDPLASHRVSVESEAGTHVLHVSLERQSVFDIDMDAHARFDTETPYDFYLMNNSFNETCQPYRMRLEEFLAGTPLQ